MSEVPSHQSLQVIFVFIQITVAAESKIKWLLTLSQTSPCFYWAAVQVFWKLFEKEKLLLTSNFSFSNSIFYPFRELATINQAVRKEIIVGPAI